MKIRTSNFPGRKERNAPLVAPRHAHPSHQSISRTQPLRKARFSASPLGSERLQGSRSCRTAAPGQIKAIVSPWTRADYREMTVTRTYFPLTISLCKEEKHYFRRNQTDGRLTGSSCEGVQKILA